MKIKLIGYKKIEGQIRCETGLHIGGSSETIEIGGMENPVIRDPITELPYIPGSSVKGKMRALWEWKLGKYKDNGDVHEWCGNRACAICRIFGTTSDEADIGPSRLIIRDAEVEGARECPISKGIEEVPCPHMSDRKVARQIASQCRNDPQCSRGLLEKLRRDKGLIYVEEKSENTINRLTARANPRQMERVPAGTRFDFEMIYRIFDCDGDGGEKDEELFQYVKQGMELIELDALGGSGSRGYGKISIQIDQNDYIDISGWGNEQL